jgi:Protein of unknown function (DUF3071)
MRRLRFIGLAEDSAHIVIQTDDGSEGFLLPIDDKLRATVRGVRGGARAQGQLAHAPDALRPREIQARVRAGCSAEQVAAESGQSLERVLRFAYPVLAERSRVVAEARRAKVRREPTSPSLAEVVDDRLAARGVDPDTVTWDSWRREDGTWVIEAHWQSGDAERTATWMFDLAGKLLAAEDDLAQHLTGGDRAFAGRLTPVTPLAAAARAAAGGEHAAEPVPPLAELVPSRPATPPPLPADRELAGGSPAESDPNRAGEAGGREQADRRQARVPSWEEILLGGAPRRPRG